MCRSRPQENIPLAVFCPPVLASAPLLGLAHGLFLSVSHFNLLGSFVTLLMNLI